MNIPERGKTTNPIRGPITRIPGKPTLPTLPNRGPIKTLPGRGPIKSLPGTGHNPKQSGDPDAGNPVKPRPEIAPRPGQGIVAGDRPPVIDEAIQSPYPQNSRNESGTAQNSNPTVPAGEFPVPGQEYGEGEVVAGNGQVVSQEFLDLVADGEFLYTNVDAPWDNPADPFWDQDRPKDWKGVWPEFGDAPNPPGGNPAPEVETEPGTDPVTPPYDPGQQPPCDDDHDDGCHRPVIIVDPYFPPVTHCPPCVVNVCQPAPCQTTVITEQVIVEVPVEGPVAAPPTGEAVAPALQLVVGSENTLEAAGLGDIAGTAGLEVNGLGIPVEVVQWNNEQLVLAVPVLGLAEPTAAVLFLFDADQQPIAEVPVELLTQPMAEQLAANQ